ncbi:DUF317 domain-containing protein [Streptomyces sp. ISL-98]|uniref:DUF317 domain-containing protein n=1 Tax=Streptomyces sp. ISL-98 TaxID=2819192 RepID=UPI001BEAB023|nr:DUF317 domain-containing protein [Streptomyces sp. ISL-98]MBT2509185.1 DUF317 domain-containing protein [Streptomyces sp. ISL-98]
MTHFAPEDRVLVSPRHLAGAGLDRLTDALGPLIHLFSWPSQRDAATGHIAIDSPDGSLFLTFSPSHPAGRWWTIAHHEPYWEVQFSRQTPIEAIAAVTQALPQLLGDRRHADRIPLTTSTLAQIADMNHWQAGDGTFTTPDGHCLLQHTPGDETPWRFQHHVYDGFDTHWHATFTQDTPEQLVAQFFTHLATTTPVERAFRDIPYLVQHLDDALITPVRRAAVNPHVHHAGAQLAHAVRRR